MSETLNTTSVAVKPASKTSQALAIFTEELLARGNGKYSTNKEFRAAVLGKFVTFMGVSTPSAATLFNSSKKYAEKLYPEIGLGRDPKKVKVKVNGKRGRPVGSKTKKTAESAEVAAKEPALV